MLLDKLGTADQRRWYAAKAIENNWSPIIDYAVSVRSSAVRALGDNRTPVPASRKDVFAALGFAAAH